MLDLYSCWEHRQAPKSRVLPLHLLEQLLRLLFQLRQQSQLDPESLVPETA